jgi:hypothetical protein
MELNTARVFVKDIEAAKHFYDLAPEKRTP